MVVHQREVFTNAPLCALFGIGIVARGDGFHNGVNHRAATSGVARCDWRKHQFGQRQAITDAQGLFTENRDEIVADARTQTGFDQTA